MPQKYDVNGNPIKKTYDADGNLIDESSVELQKPSGLRVLKPLEPVKVGNGIVDPSYKGGPRQDEVMFHGEAEGLRNKIINASSKLPGEFLKKTAAQYGSLITDIGSSIFNMLGDPTTSVLTGANIAKGRIVNPRGFPTTVEGGSGGMKPPDFTPYAPERNPVAMELQEPISGTPPYNTPQFGLHPREGNAIVPEISDVPKTDMYGNPIENYSPYKSQVKTGPVQRESLGYPLDIIPNRLRPPSTNATVFDALLPERFKVNEQGAAKPLTTAIESKLNPISKELVPDELPRTDAFTEGVTNSKVDTAPDMGTTLNDPSLVLPENESAYNKSFGKLKPIDPMESSANEVAAKNNITTRALDEQDIDHQISELAKVDHPAARREMERLISIKPAVSIANDVQSPALKAAVESPEFTDIASSFPTKPEPSSWEKIKSGMGTETTEALRKQNPLLGDLVDRTKRDSAIKAGTWTNEYDKIVSDLSDDNFSKLVSAIEGKAQLDPISDARLVDKLNQYKALDREISDTATNSGMGLKSSDGTKLIPWQPMDNYFPHMYTEEFLEKLKNNPLEIKSQLMKAGYAPLEIDSMFANQKKFGERLINAQHGRESGLPGYRVDKNVYRQHINDMAKRVTEAENYGPMDMADMNSPVMGLIKDSKNPQFTSELMKDLLDRTPKEHDPFRDASRKILGLQAWIHLGTAGISNLASTAMTPIQTNLRAFSSGVMQTVMNSQEAGEFAKSSGALQNIFREILANSIKGDKWNPMKVYGLEAGENFMRTVSANAGKAYAKQLFSELKSGNINPKNVQRLQDLILDNPMQALNQTELTEHQLKRAAFRVGEISQGLAGKENLPYYWQGSALSDILGLFHKYAFAQTKIVKDMVMRDPVRTVPLLIGASQIVGELTGDAKSLVKGTIKTAFTGDVDKPLDEVANRGTWINKRFGLKDDDMIGRVVENAGQSFALGLFTDAIDLLSGSGTDLVKGLGGPVVSDVANIYDSGKNLLKGNFGKSAKGLTKLVPIVGNPISQEMK